MAAVLSVSLILFSVIDIIGSLPIIMSMKREGVKINASVATSTAGIIMLSFLFFGSAILGLFGLEFAVFCSGGRSSRLFHRPGSGVGSLFFS